MIVLTSCSATQVTTRYRDPTATQIQFTKVLALCITRDPSLREAAEAELCRRMPRVTCKPAHFAIPDSMISDVEAAKALTLKEGFDGAVVVRVIEQRDQVTYVPPTYSYGPGFWGYYGYAWPIAVSPGYYRTDQVLLMETGIFSLTQDRALWVGTSETLNPRSLPDLVDDFAKAVRKELVSRGLIPEP